MYYTAVEQDLGGVGNGVEDTQRLFELLIIIVTQGFDPGFDFLQQVSRHAWEARIIG